MSSSRDAVIAERYLHEGETSEDQLWHRVASAWATDDSEAKEFEEMIKDGRAIPNTPALANAGRDSQMGSACFVLHVPDDTEGILQTLADATMIHKYGGGTGFDFTPVRGRGSVVSTTGRGAPGPVEGPLKGFSEWINRWSQAGIRNGANMGMLHIDHPDIIDFITAKTVEGTITNFNLSVQLTDEFMLGVEGLPLKTRDTERDAYLWDLLTRHAWLNGEPGAFFIDKVNNIRLHPETIHATNPCGEVPLLPYEACVLGSVNLAAHVQLRNGRHVMHEPDLRATVMQLTRMLDNIVEAQDYPLDIIRKTHWKYRKIGVGPMGLADALYLLGVPYDDPVAVALSEDWSRIIQEASYAASVELAHMRGAYREHRRLYGGQEHPPHEEHLPFRRNLCAQVVAPTGSIARVIPKHYDKGCPVSFGIEPHFDTAADGSFTSYVVGRELKEHTTFAGGKAFRTTTRVPASQHVRIQAAWQKHVDQAVSKTVNLPHDATQQDVKDTFKLAWELDCKGITVLRNHSRLKNVIDCPTGTCAL